MRLKIRRYGQVTAIRHKERIRLVVVIRERIAARIVGPWIIQVDACVDHGQTERRRRFGIELQIQREEVMRDTSAKADSRFAISGWVPGQSYAGVKVFVSGAEARLAVKSRIARKSEAWRGVGNCRALDSLIEVPQVETVHISLGERYTKEGVPIETIVQRELRRNFPGVLCVERHGVLPGI